MKKTLVIGASSNPARYSNMAIKRLIDNGHEVLAIGKEEAHVHGIDIRTSFKDLSDIHTVTLYLRPELQTQYIEQIKELKPQRVIFNPGTENAQHMSIFQDAGIETVEACTLVMLGNGLF
ncbi:MAG: CoA-binding protein [Flavobacteriales bacterium]|nr:CoA-binding protein [Flavobacteriales bacterium]